MKERTEFTLESQHYQWNVIASLPWEYYPADIDKMNLYAIHGSGIGIIYEAFYSSPSKRLRQDRDLICHHATII